MAKISIHFDTETEDREYIHKHIHGPQAFEAIEQIWQECFRPWRKHGFNHAGLYKRHEEASEETQKLLDDTIEYMIERYWEVVSELKEI